jgi:hypothetical protein
MACMEEVVRCPECDASLTLPSVAAGQAVQCSRCQNSFVPAPSRDHVLATPNVVCADTDSGAFQELSQGNRETLPAVERPQAGGTAMVAVIAIALCLCAFVVHLCATHMRMEIAREEISEIRKIGEKALKMNRRDDRNRLDTALSVLAPQKNWWWSCAHASLAVAFMLFCIAGLFFLNWVSWAAVDLTKLRPGVLVFSRKVADGAAAPFFRPVSMVQELWQASSPSAITSQPVQLRGFHILCWWLCFVAAPIFPAFGLLTTLEGGFIDDGGHALSRQLDLRCWAWWMAGDVAIIVAAILTIVIICGITIRQRQRFEHLSHGLD